MTMYFIALVLPRELNEKILHWKNFMQHRYQCNVGLKSPAHITIIPPFWIEEDKEAALLADVDILANTSNSFLIKTKNFSAFKPRTIFIDVEKTEELDSLKEGADRLLTNRSWYSPKSDARQFHPHITIATRDLLKKSFYEAWPMFEKENYEVEWQAESLSVLRHNKKNWDVVYTSQFNKENKQLVRN